MRVRRALMLVRGSQPIVIYRKKPLLLSAMRPLTWLCVLLLAVLSLTPGDLMIRTGFNTRLEHFVAYAGTMLVAGLGYGPRNGVRNVAGLCAYAGVLELLQNLSPGRHPSVFDFMASASGAIVGGFLSALVLAVMRRTATRTSG